MKPIKVLHIIRSLIRTGAERISLDICNELNKRDDIEVLFISMSPTNEYEELTENIPFKIINSKVFPKIIKKSIIDIKEYKQIVDEFNPDIVHSHLFWSELLSREYTKPEITYITHCHDNMIELRNFSFNTLTNKLKLARYLEKKWIIKRYSRCNNYFLTISKDSEKYYNNVLPKGLRKINLIPNAINLNKFLNQKRKNINSTLKLINVGSFLKKKNQSFLIDVAYLLKQKNISFELTLLGDGENLTQINEKINALNLKTFVNSLGKVKNVEEHLKNSDIYIHSAIYEPFGLVFIEAMAAGLPIVSLNGGGNKDLIINNFNGYLIDKPNVELFTEKILEIKNNPKLYESLSNNGLKFCKNYGIESYVDKLIKFYNKILND